MPILRPSPNFGPRRGGVRPDMVVLHYTAMPLGPALERLCDPAAEVSAHYLIARDGRVFHLVDEESRAWHAGAGSWGAIGDVNSHSIGIELDNSGAEPFAAPLMAALEALLSDVLVRRAIPPERVIAHSDMAPGRKSDPGRRFDWLRLARAGLSVWPQAGAEAGPDPDETAFRAALARFGYGRDWPTPAVLEAFRQRFRPYATGPLAPGDMVLARDLAARFPVDRGAATS